MKSARPLLLLLLFTTTAGLAQPSARGSVLQLGHVDGGTIPAANSVPGGLVFDSLGQVIYWSDGGTWSQIGAGGASSSTTAFTELELQSSSPTFDGGSNLLLFAHAIGPCGIPTFVTAGNVPQPILSTGPGVTTLTDLVGGSVTVWGGLSWTGFGSSQAAVTPTIGGSYHQTLPGTATRTTSTVDNSAAGVYTGSTAFFRGVNDGGSYAAGGYLLLLRAGIGSSDANQRAFFGMHSASAAIGGVDPSSLTNVVYIGCDAANANLQACSNDASGSATCTDLGASFPCKSYGFYDVWICAPPSASTIGYYLRRRDVPAEVAGTISSNLPSGGIFVYPQAWVSNGPSGGTAAIEVDQGYYCLSLQ